MSGIGIFRQWKLVNFDILLHWSLFLSEKSSMAWRRTGDKPLSISDDPVQRLIPMSTWRNNNVIITSCVRWDICGTGGYELKQNNAIFDHSYFFSCLSCFTIITIVRPSLTWSWAISSISQGLTEHWMALFDGKVMMLRVRLFYVLSPYLSDNFDWRFSHDLK